MLSRRDLLKWGVAGIGSSLLASSEAVALTREQRAERWRHGRRNLAWLKRALQTAIQLEFATIPPYLCAAWSIVDDAGPTKAMILDIVRDEMAHMGLACNMLKAIGGVPDLTSAAAVPTYPGHLPGGLDPLLTVALRRLTPSALDVFMAIENPKHPIVSGTVQNDTSTSIGELYQAIWKTFWRLKPTVIPSGQVVDAYLGVFEIQSLDDVERAIDGIIRQGEGSPATPADAGGAGHYYRFAELYHGCRLAQDASQQWGFCGELMPFPAVYPMADIPPGGYRQQDVADPVVWGRIELFDQTYSRMLESLESAWTGPDPSVLGASVVQMMDMAAIGKELIGTPIDVNNPALGNYGPCFRRVASILG